ncbi:ArsR/SmtB family transcription factor [Candidatus Contendibacter odensensis]|uniref:Transcriptional regulator, ArsR family n=1 Tax=Candidatus Contendobacter odensis Run_B_J11 TaxID=1400861 RepID=A0A7U7J3B6_9GAMM|nr:helix-turn-helix domain-containing protein [Candidatus Contendobacter odensis]CDH44023.1 Transcriptional regulator, ArsR family [Candidatus Contendobacter odensis Run_B_J11]
MEKLDALTALNALSQETRLDIFRYLVQIGPEGVPAGQIGEQLALPPATLSFHLKTLQHAGLVERKRQSRSLIYAAHFAKMNSLLAYLTENCCAGDPGHCATLCEYDKLHNSHPSELALGHGLESSLRGRR